MKVIIEQYESPSGIDCSAPPLPLNHKFVKHVAYEVHGWVIESGELRAVLVNNEGQVWAISNRHLRLAPTGPTIPPEDFAKREHSRISGMLNTQDIQQAVRDEIERISRELKCVRVVEEAYTTANNLLPYNSVFNPRYVVEVNLNPNKRARSPISPSDRMHYYPTAQPDGCQSVAAAIRMVGGGNLCSHTDGSHKKEPGVIVRPRTVVSLDAESVHEDPINNIVITQPCNMVRGELGPTCGIWSYPGTTATYAIDYERELILFSGEALRLGAIQGSHGVMTTNVVVSYSYAYS